MVCVICKNEFEGKEGAKTCSAKCRVTLSRQKSIVTPNVTLSQIPEEVVFRFTVRVKKGEQELSVIESKNKIRSTTKWEDVPIAAVPVVYQGDPDMPEWMNGRQYFLWWKNNFQLAEDGSPLIWNPFKSFDNFRYDMGGDASRKWGA